MLDRYANYLGEGSASNYNYNDRAWEYTFAAVRGAGTKTAKDSCLNHLFVHVDLDGTLGVAYLERTCYENNYGQKAYNIGFSTTISFGTPAPQWQTVSVTTHELGHNFGASHDCCKSGCNPSEIQAGRDQLCPGLKMTLGDGKQKAIAMTRVTNHMCAYLQLPPFFL